MDRIAKDLSQSTGETDDEKLFQVLDIAIFCQHTYIYKNQFSWFILCSIKLLHRFRQHEMAVFCWVSILDLWKADFYFESAFHFLLFPWVFFFGAVVVYVWCDDFFQIARKIVIAEIQSITYNEWLPIVLGPDLIENVSINKLMI